MPRPCDMSLRDIKQSRHRMEPFKSISSIRPSSAAMAPKDCQSFVSSMKCSELLVAYFYFGADKDHSLLQSKEVGEVGSVTTTPEGLFKAS